LAPHGASLCAAQAARLRRRHQHRPGRSGRRGCSDTPALVHEGGKCGAVTNEGQRGTECDSDGRNTRTPGPAGSPGRFVDATVVARIVAR